MRPGSVQFLREIAVSLVPRAIGRGVARGEDVAQRSAKNLTDDRTGRWDCKISSRSNYSYGRRPGMSEQIFIVGQQVAPPLG